MWVEVDEHEHRAAMLAFYPQFTADAAAEREILFLVDRSASMSSGSALVEARRALYLAIDSLPAVANVSHASSMLPPPSADRALLASCSVFFLSFLFCVFSLDAHSCRSTSCRLAARSSGFCRRPPQRTMRALATQPRHLRWPLTRRWAVRGDALFGAACVCVILAFAFLTTTFLVFFVLLPFTFSFAGTDLVLALRPLLLHAAHKRSSPAATAIVLFTDAQLTHPSSARGLLRAFHKHARVRRRG
jgi:hypothetical protein